MYSSPSAESTRSGLDPSRLFQLHEDPDDPDVLTDPTDMKTDDNDVLTAPTAPTDLKTNDHDNDVLTHYVYDPDTHNVNQTRIDPSSYSHEHCII